ncbi:MAG: hypothetical protein SRB2_03844 [Desulfobacteraceae bacterium Eth-SRB2]|nr:MAG: hypothetical protein SRB2_03844 [Desulfobacteraceae bacterium Eth-SRB2]
MDSSIKFSLSATGSVYQLIGFYSTPIIPAYIRFADEYITDIGSDPNIRTFRIFIVRELRSASGVAIFNLSAFMGLGCKSRLLFAKIAMAIWFQVSGVRKHVQ